MIYKRKTQFINKQNTLEMVYMLLSLCSIITDHRFFPPKDDRRNTEMVKIIVQYSHSFSKGKSPLNERSHAIVVSLITKAI